MDRSRKKHCMLPKGMLAFQLSLLKRKIDAVKAAAKANQKGKVRKAKGRRAPHACKACKKWRFEAAKLWKQLKKTQKPKPRAVRKRPIKRKQQDNVAEIYDDYEDVGTQTDIFRIE